MVRYPHHRRTKTRTVQSVPINARLTAVIDGMTRGKPKDNVFAYRRKRLWPDLLDPIKAGVPELRGWHDFRRTAGSLLVQAGVELYSAVWRERSECQIRCNCLVIWR